MNRRSILRGLLGLFVAPKILPSIEVAKAPLAVSLAAYKGADFVDSKTGIVYCPYIPILKEPLITTDSFSPDRQAEMIDRLAERLRNYKDGTLKVGVNER